MRIILHNLKVAFRNLMKHKFQTLISVLSIAIGIVTLSFAHSILLGFKLPTIFSEPYYDRAYRVSFKSISDGEGKKIDSGELIRAVKGSDGLMNAEQIAVPNGAYRGVTGVFLMPDSSIRKGSISNNVIDSQYANYAGMRSAITGQKIKVLKPGEALISEFYAKKLFGDKNPVGAVQVNTDDNQTIPVTIVDVFKNLSVIDAPLRNDAVYFCTAKGIEDENFRAYYAVWINIVLKEGSTKQQLINEIDDRIKPLGLQAEISDAYDDIEMVIAVRTIVYIFSSLILLAAIIGFLRMQTQLFWLRRREISLRVVNGAKKMSLFRMLAAETAITTCLSVLVALCLGYLLQDFVNSELGEVIASLHLEINGLCLYSLVIGVGLFLICCLIVWISLLRICKSGEGLAANMRRSRNHLFRNVMLGIQLTICSLFICCTFILVRGGDEMMKAFSIPANDDFYRECLMLSTVYAEHPEQLLEEIGKIPELDEMIMEWEGYYRIANIENSPEAVAKLGTQAYYGLSKTTDTALLSFLGVDVEWLGRDTDQSQCFLMSEKLYNQFRELGVMDNNTITFTNYTHTGPEDVTMPVAGILRNIPYNRNQEWIVAINPDWGKELEEFILVPKEGKGKTLALKVNETIDRLEPQIVNDMVSNFRHSISSESLLVSAACSGGWILGVISLIICAMSIFSTIALDTRYRKKEVAIRKVNGAKSKNIYLMFARVYLVLIVVAMVIVVPVCVIFNTMISKIVNEVAPEATLSPVVPIILGFILNILLVITRVCWQIYRVMQVDRANIIAKV